MEDLLKAATEPEGCDSHLEINAVEFIKARPRAAARKPLEELAHCDVVQRVTAVEDDALPRERLGKVLCGFGLASASRALGRATERQMDGAHEGAVAAVRQRCDDQPAAVA